MCSVQVRDAPAPLCGPFEIPCAIFDLRLENAILDDKAISGKVLSGTLGMIDGNNLGFDDRVLQAVEHGINAERKDVLVVMGINARGDGCSVRSGFVRTSNIDLQDSSKANLNLNVAVLVEVEIPDIFYMEEH